MAIIGIYGASGFGREVMPLVRASHDANTRCVFIDDAANGPVNGYACLSFNEFLAESDEKSAAVAISNANTREKLQNKLLDHGVALANVLAPNSVFGDECEIGAGSIFCSYAMMTSNIKVGTGFQANLYSYIAHDCVIGDYVTFAPMVACNGNIVIEDYAYIGTGAVLKQGQPGKPTIIGRGAIVGMGAVVTKDVAPGDTVIGNPARPR